MCRLGRITGSAICLILSFSMAFAQGEKQYSTSSMIVEVEASACLGQERSRVETQKLALDEAKLFVVSKSYVNLDEETRGLTVLSASPGKEYSGKAEFAETKVNVKVRK